MSKKYNRQIGINSIISVLKLILTTIMYFGFYKYILTVLGIDALGVWSLLLSIALLINIGGNGIGTGLVKYGAELHYQNKIDTLSAVSNYMFVFFLLFALLIGACLVFLSNWIFQFALENQEIVLNYRLGSVFKVLLFSAILNMLARSVFSLIDAINLSYLHSLAHFLGTFVFIGLGVLFLEKHQLIGLAFCHLLFSLFYLISALIFVKVKLPSYRFFYFRWNARLMREIVVYNLNFQISGIFQILMDPLNKFLFSKYGGLDLTACYEMANKVVFSVRALVVSVLNNVIPKLSRDNLNAMKQSTLRNYTILQELNTLFAILCLFCLQFFGWIFSLIYFGELNTKFIFIFTILSLSWFLNSLSLPAYFMNLGSGKLRDNTFSIILQSVINIFFGFIIGNFLGGKLVALSIPIGLGLGAFYIVFQYNKRLGDKIQWSLMQTIEVLIGITVTFLHLYFGSPLASFFCFIFLLITLTLLRGKTIFLQIHKIQKYL